MAAKQEFESRFAKHKDELEWLFMELYHNREGLEVLEQEMAQAYNARSAELKALDKARSADPEWYKRGNMFGMTMYTDLFAGNLKELARKLPYLKEQKLTYLHLMPLLQMLHPHNDGGYAVEDFDTVDPALGTNKDLENLTRELRKAGISLCLDFVMNHTASTHRWAMAAKAGDPWFQAYYHLYEDRTIPDRYEQTVPQVFPNTAPGNFTWCEDMHKWVLTTFHDYQWDLNYANPAVFVDMMFVGIDNAVSVIAFDNASHYTSSSTLRLDFRTSSKASFWMRFTLPNFIVGIPSLRTHESSVGRLIP